MAPDSGQHRGKEVFTVLTCEGTLGHPEFPQQFKKVVNRLNGLLGVPVKVRKLEPWNSVRVTLSVPREAAEHLRQLAQQDASQLRALGILSVQLDGECAISLRLQGANGEPQEVILRTTQDGSTANTLNTTTQRSLGSLLSTTANSGTSSSSSSSNNSNGSTQVQFKSPNVVCPPDSVVPRVVGSSAMGPPPQTAIIGSSSNNSHLINKPPYAGPFPFASMNQAIHSNNSATGAVSRTNNNNNSTMEPPPFLPPPYPGIRQTNTAGAMVQPPNHPIVSLSSPLLVNLLQNDQQQVTSSSSTSGRVPELLATKVLSTTIGGRQMRPPPPPSSSAPLLSHKVSAGPLLNSLSHTTVPSVQQQQQPQQQQLQTKLISTVSSHQAVSNLNLITSQANNNMLLVNSNNNNNNSVSSSPSALLSTSSVVSSTNNTMPLLVSHNNNNTNNNNNNSTVTSTQLAINNIANSLASAANNITNNISNIGAQQQQTAVFGVSKSSFHGGGVHYQRTPQGSIIAVNKPQTVAIQNSIPLYQAQRAINMQMQNTPQAAVLRQQQQQQQFQQQQQQLHHPQQLQQQNISGLPHQKNNIYGQNNALSSQQNNLLNHLNQGHHNIKVVTATGNLMAGNGMMTINNNNNNNNMSGVLNRKGASSSSQNVMNQGLNIGQGLQNNINLGLNQNDAIANQIASVESTIVTNVVVKKPLPSPPSYSVAISSRNNWDSLMVGNPSNLLDLAPSLTDLKPDELDELLPSTLDHDHALPELSELELLGSALNPTHHHHHDNVLITNNGSCDENSSSTNHMSRNDLMIENSNSTNNLNTTDDGRKFLINPLTGELELMHSEDEESDTDDVKDVFTGLSSPIGLSDDDTNSTNRPDTATDQSDSETRSSTEGRYSRAKSTKLRREGRGGGGGGDSPAQKPEKIKLRLKLEKNEPVNPSAYKVDVSFINSQQPKKATTSSSAMMMGGGQQAASGIQQQMISGSGGEELRVPPLHISLRGRNSAVIKNKNRLNPDGTPIVKKVRKLQQGNKMKRESGAGSSDQESGKESGELNEYNKKTKRFKTNNYEHKDLLAALSDHHQGPTNNSLSKFSSSLNNHYKDKQKERRGSDSELVKSNFKKHPENGALLNNEKRRRLSQSEGGEKGLIDESISLQVPGSTNVGTVAVLPQKIRKDKMKLKDSFKAKEVVNKKTYNTSSKSTLAINIPLLPLDNKNKQQQTQHSTSTVALPTATDMDMEAKFKQSLMEGVIGEKGISRPPHRTVEIVGNVQRAGEEGGVINEKPLPSPSDISHISEIIIKEKSSLEQQPEKCNLQDTERKSIESLQDKQLNNVVTSGGRSPNSGSSGGQGEDSGIESMDALSEKSPNQASQSPHADIIQNVVVTTSSSKSQTADILDIEAQLAKMEGLEPHQELTLANNSKGSENQVKNLLNDKKLSGSQHNIRPNEDINENECSIHRNSDSKPCCDLTCTLQDDKESLKSQLELVKEEITCVKTIKAEEKQQPQDSPSLRVAPALYSYPSSAVDKGGGIISDNLNIIRGGNDSPMIITTEDEDSNMAPSHPQQQQQQSNNKNKSLLEQLLIEIPNNEHHGNNSATPNSHSPATRSSVRTRALSKLNSPEINNTPISSKIAKQPLSSTTAKRKRNESDSSTHSVEELRKRPRKGSEASEVAGKRIITNTSKKAINKTIANIHNNPQQQDDSSDSDEPLSEKLRKTVPKSGLNKLVNKSSSNNSTQAGTHSNHPTSQVNNKANIRRSARAGLQQDKPKQHQPAQNTRSREKVGQQQLSTINTQNNVQQQQQQQQHSNSNNTDAEAALRRKTRSADMESKRKKEIK